MERLDGPKRKLKRVAGCLAIASFVFLLILIIPREAPPFSEAFRLWIFSHIGPLLLFPDHWPDGLIAIAVCLALILPTILRQDAWFQALCTGGFLLWIFAGFAAIVESI